MPLDTPYLVIEYITPSRGTMLSETWEEGRSNPTLRANLFHGLSRIMLNLARIPLPRIESFSLDKNGCLSLSNRPLTLEIQQLENEKIPVDIRRDSTHTSVESFVHDTFSLHESRLRYQLNAVNSVEDGFYQTSALMVLRSVWPCFFRRDLFRGPFFLNLTDLNQSNIFVDKDWNIVCLIDLEWACSHPVDMIHPPYWLTNQAIDLISLDEYSPLHTEFMDAFAEEEKEVDPEFHLYPIMKEGLESGTFWCSLALTSPTALFKIFYDYIQPRFSKTHEDPAFWRITMPYWSFGTFAFIQTAIRRFIARSISIKSLRNYHDFIQLQSRTGYKCFIKRSKNKHQVKANIRTTETKQRHVSMHLLCTAPLDIIPDSISCRIIGRHLHVGTFSNYKNNATQTPDNLWKKA